MSPQGWMLYTGSGCLCTAGASDSKWEGQPGKWELKEGDVVVRPTPLCLSHGVAHSVCLGAGPAARPRRGHHDGVGQRRAEGRHGPARHDRRFRGRFPRRAGGAAGRAAAMGGRDGLDLDAAMVGDHRRPVAAAHLGRREKEDCLFTAELCPHRQRASRAKPLYFAGRRPPCSARSAQLPNPCTCYDCI